jgi:transcription initiation factor TFIID subunit TAF12
VFFDLNAAAQYLGVDANQLRDDLRSGQSLAQVAQARGKSVQGLEQALLDAAKARLDQQVKDGQITQDEAQQRLQSLQQRIGDFVNRVGRPPQGPGGQGGGQAGSQ